MKDYILYILVLIILSLSIKQIHAQDEYDDLDYQENEITEEYISSEYITPLKTPPSIFKSFEQVDENFILSSAPDEPKLVVTICYDDIDRGYYCKDLP